ncbi:Retrovirus-related Pol polyprotein from transposon TNT 1-94 [Anthophora retusa]
MNEGDDVRSHMNKSFDIKALPASFENFRCAIESRDELPDAESLKVKILEEYDARIQKSGSTSAMASSSQRKNNERNKIRIDKQGGSTQAKNYNRSSNNKFSNDQNANVADDDAYFAFIGNMNQNHSELIHDDRKWIIDSGLTAHLCKNDDIFEDMSDSSENLNLTNNESTNIKGRDLRSNLMSVSKIIDKGNLVIFDENVAVVKDKQSKEVKLIADRIGNLYYLRKTRNEEAKHIKEGQLNSLVLWHNRMAHLNEKSLRKVMLKTGNIKFRDSQGTLKCDIYAMGKQTAQPFDHKCERCKGLLDIVHSDVCGPFNVSTIGEKDWVLARYILCSSLAVKM